MNELVLATSAPALRIVEARCPVSVRVATADDVSFIDGLQKRHRKQVGWMPEKALAGKIGAGQVIVAEDRGTGFQPVQTA